MMQRVAPPKRTQRSAVLRASQLMTTMVRVALSQPMGQHAVQSRDKKSAVIAALFYEDLYCSATGSPVFTKDYVSVSVGFYNENLL